LKAVSTILDSVREIVSPGNMPATVSVGIGKMNRASWKTTIMARGLDMALSEGATRRSLKTM
jgi:c-di-AMP phosphodiesterase-like protein